MAKKNRVKRTGIAAVIVGALLMIIGVMQYNSILFTNAFFQGLYQDTFIAGLGFFLVGLVLLISGIRIS